MNGLGFIILVALAAYGLYLILRRRSKLSNQKSTESSSERIAEMVIGLTQIPWLEVPLSSRDIDLALPDTYKYSVLKKPKYKFVSENRPFRGEYIPIKIANGDYEYISAENLRNGKSFIVHFVSDGPVLVEENGRERKEGLSSSELDAIRVLIKYVRGQI